MPALHINTAIYYFSKFKFEVQFRSWDLFEVESISKLSRSKLGLLKLSPFRSRVLFEVESFEVQSFEVGSFEVGSYGVRSFEVQSFEVQSVNRSYYGNDFVCGPHSNQEHHLVAHILLW